MGLNVSKGNMYSWLTHTWNTVKGVCPHGCTYCYMKQHGEQQPLRFVPKEFAEFDRDMKIFGEGQFIFVGSSCDMFADDVLHGWIRKTFNKCAEYQNKYLFQSKNPLRFVNFESMFPKFTALCTTIETNRWYDDIMVNSPRPELRANNMGLIKLPKYVTIEPIMDFDLDELVELIKRCDPLQVNIGANTSKVILPEPSERNIHRLVGELEKFTKVKQKTNLKRLYNKDKYM